MSIALTDTERARIRRIARKPRSRKQLYRAEALLALDEGHPVETVARQFRVGVDRVESWIGGFERLRLRFLLEPSNARPATTDDPDPGLDEGDDA